ncbi:10910_t:CDS:2, partial [Entrophospora sp. SA101]
INKLDSFIRCQNLDRLDEYGRIIKKLKKIHEELNESHLIELNNYLEARSNLPDIFEDLDNYVDYMSDIFTHIGFIISGIKEKLSGVNNIVSEQAPAQPEIKSPIIEEIRNRHSGRVFIGQPTCHSLGDILKSFKKPIDIIKQSIPSGKGKKNEIIPESPAESSSQAQRREEARVQKKKLGIVPKDNEVNEDELLLLESVQEKIKSVLRLEQSKKKRIQFSILLQATMERTVMETDEDGVSYMRNHEEDHTFKTTMDYIFNESNINDELISNSYDQICQMISKFIYFLSGYKFKKGIYIDVQVVQYIIARVGSYIETPKNLTNTKGTINPDNSETKDNNCLQWAICAFNADRLSEAKDKWLAVNESSVQATSYQEQKPRHEELERP